MTILNSRAFFAVACIAALAAPAMAQLDEQQKLLAKRAAEADAYRKLAETIKGIQINSETFVRDFVTESDVIESGLDEFIKGVRLGKATYYDDGTCEVEAEVTVAQVVQTLKELHTRHYEGSRIVGTDFDNIENNIKKEVVKAVGMGAPRPELPPDLPQGVAEMLPPPPAPTGTMSYPAIWQSVSPQGKLMAAQAARRDAQRKLLERILGVRINSQTLVRDFVTESDTIKAEANGLVVGAEETEKYYHHDELIVEVTMSVPTEQVIRTIRELHTRHYQGNQVSGTDIEKLTENIVRKSFEATGAGVPGERFKRQAEAPPTGGAVASPTWLGTKITAVGQGTDNAIDTPQGKLKAIRAATADARRKLLEQIDGLQISSETYVRDFVTERDEIRSQMQSVIAGSVVENQEVKDGIASVTVSVGGPEVWRVLGAQMEIDSHHRSRGNPNRDSHGAATRHGCVCVISTATVKERACSYCDRERAAMIRTATIKERPCQNHDSQGAGVISTASVSKRSRRVGVKSAIRSRSSPTEVTAKCRPDMGREDELLFISRNRTHNVSRLNPHNPGPRAGQPSGTRPMTRFINAAMTTLVLAAALLAAGCGDNVRTTKTVTTHEQEDPQMINERQDIVE